MVLDRFPGNSDTIYGFVAGTDRLEINAADFAGGLTAGQALDPGQLLLNGTGLAGDADDRFILNTTTGELFYDVNGSVGGATGSQLIAVFAGGIPTLTSSDFVIV
jgi:hypothetical protein